MATVVNCASGGGRMIAINTPQAVPLALSIAYLQPGSQSPVVFGTPASPEVAAALSSAGVANSGARSSLSNIGLVTAVSAKQSVIVQIQNALSNAIFVTPFGDGAGDIAISFISNRLCTDPNNVTVEVIQHYLNHRILPTRNRGAAIIVIGTSVFRGHLIALDSDNQGGELPIRRGTLYFKAWPQ